MSGNWEFWTLFGDSRSVTGRCREGHDPGERFRRMENDEEYTDAWDITTTAVGIRPASSKAVAGWLNSHPERAQCVEFCNVAGVELRILKTEEGYRLEEL